MIGSDPMRSRPTTTMAATQSHHAIESPDRTTTNNRDELIQMFVDGTSGEAYGYGRLKTQTNDEGNVELISFHEKKIAELDESEGLLVVYNGHRGQASQTVERYLNRVWGFAQERSTVEETLSEQSPEVRDKAITEVEQFVGRYIDFSSDLSPLEQWANQRVDEVLKQFL